jgi:hypothetical protein
MPQAFSGFQDLPASVRVISRQHKKIGTILLLFLGSRWKLNQPWEVFLMQARTSLLFAFAAIGFSCAAIGYAGAQSSTPSNTIPATMTVCETPHPNLLRVKENCGTLTWNGQQYDAQWPGVEGLGMKGPATTATVTIGFDNDGSVKLDRTDTAGTTYTATYHGKIAADNTVAGTLTWYNNGVFFAKGTWTGNVTMPVAKAAEAPAPEPAPAPAPMPPIPPPAAPQDQPGPAAQIAVSIDSTPAGADIEVDGAFVGNTPSTVNLAIGSHDIAVKKKGFADWTKKLNVTGGNIHLKAEMEAVSHRK